MEIAAILALIDKGLTIGTILLEAGQSEGAKRAFQSVKDFVSGAKKESPTKEAIEKTETVLDALLDEFNEPLPEA